LEEFAQSEFGHGHIMYRKSIVAMMRFFGYLIEAE
jgi:hypothetical protein